MKVLILNGNPSAENKVFDEYLQSLSRSLQELGDEVNVSVLRDMNIKFCQGCWDCWLKTPGECCMADDSRTVSRDVINSDFVLFASPVVMGFTSALLKKAMDRMIPLIHPYFALVQDEFHHRPRYEKYPLFGLLLEKGDDTDEEDIEIITDIFRRASLDLKTSLEYMALSENPAKEVAREINGIQRVSTS